MKVQSLGHVVLNVSDLVRSEKFYHGLLGMPVCARLDEQGMKMTFFSLGNHHDLAISEVPAGHAAGGHHAVGLNHVAFCIGGTLDELREAKALLEGQGIKFTPVDHDVTKSLYFDDPDGNMIELYVDVSSEWREDPQRIAYVDRLNL